LNHFGLCYSWANKSKMYNDAPLKTVILNAWLYGGSIVYSRSMPVMRQILSLNSPFEKVDTKDLNFMGLNLVTAQNEFWKRHRRITAPAFNQKTYRNVWETTANVYHDMVKNEGWEALNQTGVVKANHITHKLALFIIGIVGFGLPMKWVEEERDSQGRLSLQKMIFDVSNYILLRARAPKFAYALGNPLLNRVNEAYETFESFMHEQIKIRETELEKVRSTPGATEDDIADAIGDVFGRLVSARSGDGKLTMSDEEIIGNCFIFVFAGHETTANTLGAALALLAVNQDVQEDLFKSIMNAIGTREPCFEDYDALQDVLACFYEALRMYPAAYMMIRQPKADTILNIPQADDPTIVEPMHIKEGTVVVMDIVGMFYDPQIFPDPYEFKPSRWTRGAASEAGSSLNQKQADEVSMSASASAMDGFIGFSIGPRTCLGHKFAKIEAVAFLTHLLREWRVEPVLNEGEDAAQWRARVLDPSFLITLAFGDIPVRFVRRAQL